MSLLMQEIDSRTQLIGKNRLELLIFKLADQRHYGINVFKVNEVMLCPEIVVTEYSKPEIRGIVNIRDKIISVIDLSLLVNKQITDLAGKNYLIVAEFNNYMCGFIVNSVDRIVNLDWDQIEAPPTGLCKDSLLTSVTHHNNELVQVIDIERIASDLKEDNIEYIPTLPHESAVDLSNKHILVVDDSRFARSQIADVLTDLGVHYTMTTNGKDALDKLISWQGNNDANNKVQCDLIVADIEMPVMDGYTLTRIVKANPALKDINLMLHSSMSATLNDNIAQQVGADDYLHKFNPNDLGEKIRQLLD